MGATDFDFGFNDPSNADPWGRNTGPHSSQRSGSTDEPSHARADSGPVSDLAEITCAQVKKMVHNITETVRKANRQPMDLSTYRGKESSNGRGKFENRDWLDSQKDLPKKGPSKWKIDGVREAKKNKTGILAFVDVTSGAKKRVMSLRKGFTLDAFMDELGTNTDKWKGKSIQLERGGDEGQYVNVAQ
jgi:hypothetical protein